MTISQKSHLSTLNRIHVPTNWNSTEKRRKFSPPGGIQKRFKNCHNLLHFSEVAKIKIVNAFPILLPTRELIIYYASGAKFFLDFPRDTANKFNLNFLSATRHIHVRRSVLLSGILNQVLLFVVAGKLLVQTALSHFFIRDIFPRAKKKNKHLGGNPAGKLMNVGREVSSVVWSKGRVGAVNLLI